MPHECTNCGKVFPDGSKQMLSGCPGCGGNKFQFRPAGRAAGDDGGDAGPNGPDADDAHPGGDAGPRSSTDRTSTTPDRSGGPPSAQPASSGSQSGSNPRGPPDDPTGSTEPTESTGRSTDPPRPTPDASPPDRSDAGASEAAPRERDSPAADDGSEDTAQASARSDVVSPDELATAARSDRPNADGPSRDVDGQVIEPRSDERPGLDELREELNEQFESIKILNPGQYELNLMELYNREEYIISLQEDGRYVIEVPDTWRGRDR